jgi:hypothetical protein
MTNGRGKLGDDHIAVLTHDTQVYTAAVRPPSTKMISPLM